MKLLKNNYKLDKTLINEVMIYNYSKDITLGGYVDVNLNKVKVLILEVLEVLYNLPKVRTLQLEEKVLFEAMLGFNLTSDEIDLCLDNELVSTHLLVQPTI